MKKKIYIISFQHNDLVWRRGFRKDIEFRGQNFIPYRDLEEFYIKESIALCEKYEEYKFEIESVAVLREFLSRNSDYKEKIAQLLKADRIYIPFSGDNIIDSNLTGGESIVRNYLYGYEYLRNNFDYTPVGVDRLDAFGNSGQLPQIVRGFGEKLIFNVSYSECDKDYFMGIDGSIVYNFKANAVGMVGGGVPKYRPCPACKGNRNIECDVCKNKRIDVEYLNTYGGLVNTPIINYDKINSESGPYYITSGGEEIIPNEEIVLFTRENSETFDFAFGTFKDMFAENIGKANVVDSPDKNDIFAKRELNCNNTGVFASRIKLKQGVRRLENLITAAENLAVSDFVNGNDYPKEKLLSVWQKALFCMFHDCITGTIVDGGYTEITESLKSAEALTEEIIKDKLYAFTDKRKNVVSVYNPYGIKLSGVVEVTVGTDCDITLCGADILEYSSDRNVAKIKFFVKDIAPFSVREYEIKQFLQSVKTKEYDFKTEINTSAVLQNDNVSHGKITDENYVVIENKYYKLTANRCGVCEIYSKKLSRTVAKKGDYYIGEWILESDFGSPWATLSRDRRRQPMGEYTQLVSTEITDTAQKITFKVLPDSLAGYSICGSEVCYSVVLPNNSEMIYFFADVRWDEQNMRYRVAFPTNSVGKNIYEIPYGLIEREEYEDNIIRENGSSNWSAACGEYPAQNFAGVEGAEFTTAVFNKGTPSYKIETCGAKTSNIFITPLRSPSVGTYLHSPREYTMTDYDGMRDVGQHSFEFALNFYADGFDRNTAVADGIGFNAELCVQKGELSVAQMPIVSSNGVRISAIKSAENENAVVVRLAEYHGMEQETELFVPKWGREAFLSDMKEEGLLKLAIGTDGTTVLKFRPFEIKTLLIKL